MLHQYLVIQALPLLLNPSCLFYNITPSLTSWIIYSHLSEKNFQTVVLVKISLAVKQKQLLFSTALGAPQGITLTSRSLSQTLKLSSWKVWSIFIKGPHFSYSQGFLQYFSNDWNKGGWVGVKVSLKFITLFKEVFAREIF